MAVPTFRAAELAAATGGVWRQGVVPRELLSGIVTDTRRACAGALFLALAGERFDAHNFLRNAIAGGCAALCIEASKADRLPPECYVPVLEVADTLAAYRDIAHFHRLRFPSLRLAAVTGSVGKTSVKEMLRAIFEAAAGPDAVLYTEGNTNNQIGVPQNLLRLEERHRYAVIEAGTNHPGEIEPLSRCAAPQIALINSIAPCHLEFLGSLAGVAREKAHLFDGLPENGCAVIPGSCPEVGILEDAARNYATVLRFGETADCAVRARYFGGRLAGSRFELTFPDGKQFEVEWALSGRHQAVTASAAACAAHLCERRLQRQSRQHAGKSRMAGRICGAGQIDPRAGRNARTGGKLAEGTRRFVETGTGDIPGSPHSFGGERLCPDAGSGTFFRCRRRSQSSCGNGAAGGSGLRQRLPRHRNGAGIAGSGTLAEKRGETCHDYIL